MNDQEYIGDGVYVSHDGYHVWLRTQREAGPHEIAMEPEVFRNLLQWVRQVETKHENYGYWTGDEHPQATLDD